MRWWPTTCQPGDMIRVHIGSIEHYGIFVSEEEVIQFGLPPIPEYRDQSGDIVVLATDIDTFSCGNIVEVAAYDKKEAGKCYPRKQIVENARSKLGRGGYDFIHYNCEHFAYECVFGIRRSSQEENARRKWNSRPILDVYIATVPEHCTVEDVIPEARNKEIQRVRHEKTKQQKYIAWKTLAYAVQHSFRMQMNELDLVRDKYGKWQCEELKFSITHTDGAVAVAVSNGAVGVDMENLAVAGTRYADQVATLRRKVFAPEEWEAYPEESVEELLTVWTKKESLFKGYDGTRFRPDRIQTVGRDVITYRIGMQDEMLLSVCGDRLPVVCVYYYDGQAAHILDQDTLRSGKKIWGESD